VLLDLTKARLHSEWYHVPAVDTRSDAESRFAAYVSDAGSSRLTKA